MTDTAKAYYHVLSIADALLVKSRHYWLSSDLPSWKGGWRYVRCTSLGPKWVTFKEDGIEAYRIARESKDHSVGSLWAQPLERRVDA